MTHQRCPCCWPSCGCLGAGRAGRAPPRTACAAIRRTSRGHRALLRSRRIVAEPADQAGHRKIRGSGGGRPVSYDVQGLKQRNVVERFFNRMKNWRGLASRYDKHALVYRGGVVLAAILDWLR